jgi:hypothetical protein
MMIGVLVTLALMAWCIGSSARADLPRPPKPTPAPETPAPEKAVPELAITADGSTKVAHLRLPKSVIQSLANPQNAPHADAQLSPTRTVVAGVALASALAISGLFLARGRGGRGRIAIVCAIVSAIGVLTTMAIADVPPFNPNTVHHRPSRYPAAGDQVTVPVIIETAEDGQIELKLPAEAAAKVAALPTTRPSTEFTK